MFEWEWTETVALMSLFSASRGPNIHMEIKSTAAGSELAKTDDANNVSLFAVYSVYDVRTLCP